MLFIQVKWRYWIKHHRATLFICRWRKELSSLGCHIKFLSYLLAHTSMYLYKMWTLLRSFVYRKITALGHMVFYVRTLNMYLVHRTIKFAQSVSTNGFRLLQQLPFLFKPSNKHLSICYVDTYYWWR